MINEKQIEEKHELSESIYMSGHGLDWKDSDDIAEQLYTEGYRKQIEGEWIYQEYSMGHYVGKCNLCECEADMTKYCPNCGAKMKGGAE